MNDKEFAAYVDRVTVDLEEACRLVDQHGKPAKKKPARKPAAKKAPKPRKKKEVRGK